MLRHPEQTAQIQVVRWLRQFRPGVLFTSPAAAGERLNFRKAVRVKMMGYTAGTPDLQIYEPRQGFHGLFVEMKREKGGRIEPEQKAFLEASAQRGYKVEVCHGTQAAVDAITAYLDGGGK